MNWIQESGLLILIQNEKIAGYVGRVKSGYYYCTDNPLEPQTSITMRGLGEPFTLEQAKDRLVSIATKNNASEVVLESN
jgi:hypothetical protein